MRREQLVRSLNDECAQHCGMHLRLACSCLLPSGRGTAAAPAASLEPRSGLQGVESGQNRRQFDKTSEPVADCSQTHRLYQSCPSD